jgi:hypothetical protein
MTGFRYRPRQVNGIGPGALWGVYDEQERCFIDADYGTWSSAHSYCGYLNRDQGQTLKPLDPPKLAMLPCTECERMMAAFRHFLIGIEGFCAVIGYPEDREMAQRIIRESLAMIGEKK